VFFSFPAGAVELRFTETQMPLLTTDAIVALSPSDYASFGISVTGAYRYHDPSDPFPDGTENYVNPNGGQEPYGLALGANSALGRLDFLSPVNNLGIDLWAADTSTIYLDIYGPSNNLLGSAVFDPSDYGGDPINANIIFFLLNIGYFTWHDSGSNVMISNIRFDAPVPEPTSILLLGTGLGVIGLAAWRRRK
jgi:hypothetical protein